MSAQPVKCWICGAPYVDECPECGPPMPLGPVQADYERVKDQSLLAEEAERDHEDRDYWESARIVDERF